MTASGGWVLLSVASLGFLLGSAPFGILISRFFGVKDLKERGSGNIGATNVSRVVGLWPAGVLTFLADSAKGAVAVVLARPEGVEWIVGSPQAIPPIAHTEWFAWLVALAAVLGHCYSPWLRFKGGKGVATSFGVAIMLSPLAALAGGVVFILTFLAKRIGSLASLAGILTIAVTHLVLNPLGSYLWIGAALIGLILIRHEANIDALLENREKSF